MRRAKKDQVGGSTSFYATPDWCVHRLLDRVQLPRGRWIELGIGQGAIASAVHAHSDWYARGLHWTGVEIDPTLAAIASSVMNGSADDMEPCLFGSVFCADALDTDLLAPPYDVAIMNPPNDLAEEFLLRALELAPVVAMIQPLQFYAAAERQELFEAHPPSDVLVIPDRPQFTAEGSPMQVYAWFMWRPGSSSTQMDRLGLTPIEVRRTHKLMLEGLAPRQNAG